ncbi:MAG: hypothetical protein RJA99_3696 [Pseudomonadota bacterium]|jgi:AcrR family transcriptional regulator
MTPTPARKPARTPAAAARRRKPAQRRMPREERRAQILAKAREFFAENGLGAQTRALADACGVSQRLLYSVFPSKSALLEEVYREHIAGPFRETWIDTLKDRRRPMEDRLVEFYRTYYDEVTTRGWLRLFLHASLAEVTMAPAYIAAVITRMLGVVVAEAAREQGLRAPRDKAVANELGWVLHGAVSHLAIRRHVYGNDNPMPPHEVIAMQVRVFLGGLRAVLPPA